MRNRMSEVCHVVAQVDIAQSNSLIESLWFQKFVPDGCTFTRSVRSKRSND